MAPRAMVVDPSVMEELVRLALAMFDSVLLPPEMVLFVSIWEPDNVATVESIAIVTAEEPLKLVPLSPVPIVRALVVLAVTVAVPPKLTALPLIVMLLFVKLLLPMFDRVLSLPETVLFVRV